MRATGGPKHVFTAPVELTTLVHLDDAQSSTSTSGSQPLSQSQSNKEQVTVVIDESALTGPLSNSNKKTVANESVTGNSKARAEKRLSAATRFRPERPTASTSDAPTTHKAGPLKAFLEAAQLTLTGRASVPSGLVHLSANAAASTSVPRDYHAVLFAFVKDGNVRGVTTVLNNHVLNLNYRDSVRIFILNY